MIEVDLLIAGRMQKAMLKGMVDPTLDAAGSGAWVAGLRLELAEIWEG
ncbi:hypothetical protein [Vulcanococcus limneticus]